MSTLSIPRFTFWNDYATVPRVKNFLCDLNTVFLQVNKRKKERRPTNQFQTIFKWCETPMVQNVQKPLFIDKAPSIGNRRLCHVLVRSIGGRTKMLRLLLFISVCACAVQASKRTLVLVDNWSIRETHSVYFRTLRGEFVSHVKTCTCMVSLFDYGLKVHHRWH